MKQLILIMLTLLLTGCVTGKYQSFSEGVGYQSIQENDNIFIVSYTGGSTTKVEKVNDFALLRCAELTLELGYQYFVISDAVNN